MISQLADRLKIRTNEIMSELAEVSSLAAPPTRYPVTLPAVIIKCHCSVSDEHLIDSPKNSNALKPSPPVSTPTLYPTKLSASNFPHLASFRPKNQPPTASSRRRVREKGKIGERKFPHFSKNPAALAPSRVPSHSRKFGLPRAKK